MRPLLNLHWHWRRLLQRFILPTLLLVLASQAIMSPAQATGVYEMPLVSAGDPTWIVDQADLLSRITKGQLTKNLETLAKETGDEVRIVTIHRLDYGETAQSFADQLFAKWFPTPEAQAHQALVVIDNVTNNTAMHVGSAVQEKIPDAIAESITQETMMVPVRKGNYNQAFLDVSDRLSAILTGKPDPGPPQVEDNIRVEGTFKSAEESKEERGSATILVIGFLIAATVIPMATYYFYQYMQSQ